LTPRVPLDRLDEYSLILVAFRRLIEQKNTKGAGMTGGGPLSLVARFRVITPMFLGGADGHASRFRPESLKGGWCYWWRAMLWSRHLANSGGDRRMALRTLAERQRRLFGAPADERWGLGQSPIVFTAIPARPRTIRGRRNGSCGTVAYPGPNNAGLRYLGYGVIQPAPKALNKRDRIEQGEVLYDAFAPGEEVPVGFRLSSRFTPEDQAEVLDALKLLGLIGGLGRRTRRGFGSLKLLGISPVDGSHELSWQPRPGLDGYREDLQELLKRYDSAGDQGLPAIDAFSAKAAIDVRMVCGDWQAALNWAGSRMLHLRSWGFFSPKERQHLLPDFDPALQLFKDDHDFAAARGKTSGYVPARTVFGLPHRYEKRRFPKGNSPGNVFSLTIEPADPGTGRRASPLLLHVHELDSADGESTSPCVVITRLPAIFLPGEGRVHASLWQGLAKDDTARARIKEPKDLRGIEKPRSYAPDWSVLDAFLDGRVLPTDPGRSLPRIDREQVWP